MVVEGGTSCVVLDAARVLWRQRHAHTRACRQACTWRQFEEGNVTALNGGWVYSAEMLFHEVMTGAACVARAWRQRACVPSAPAGNATRRSRTHVTAASPPWWPLAPLQMLLASPHRTMDPEEADLFFVPAYACCYAWPVHDAADFPWWHTPGACTHGCAGRLLAACQHAASPPARLPCRRVQCDSSVCATRITWLPRTRRPARGAHG